MSTLDGGESEYESDPEELNQSLATRRREASDEDDDDDDQVVRNQRGVVDYEEEEDVIENDKMVKEEGDGTEDEKEKKQATVPTGGAFYMHDDRFQQLSGGRNRGRRGGRPWGSGDERKWGHDKFEEMNTHEKHYDRASRGRFRGRATARGRGYTRGGASTTSGQQIYLPKDVTRGRGPRKYDSPLANVNQSKQLRNSHGSQNSHEKVSHHDSRRLTTAPTKTGNEGVYVKKNVVASSLSSASRPFYPSESASNLVHGVQVGMERLHTNERAAPSGQKNRNTKPVFPPVAQNFQSTSQGRSAPAAGNMFYPQSHSHGDRYSPPMQFNGGSKGTGQSSNRPSGQGFDQHSAVTKSLSLSSSSQKTSSSRNRYPPGEIESVAETGASIAKGKGTLQPSGSDSFVYSGSQVIGRAESLASGDNSNFQAFLPVMQFGGQHGGVPTFGMAFPGYYQSEDGVANPEMTWMPVLTGPGGLGASYSPPYAAIDGSYQARKPGLPSSTGSSSKGNSTNNLNDLENPMERPDVTESGVSQRQNNNPSKQPRRYSEMSFGK
ncbi:hypothetical protein AALP_AA1G172200 [Arabis alpina]|uniref:Btz domain-containing protein n=1 Tax=Arabis alpina TaxID=50452 RepID=A0A087HNT3_ARAAL|nr:hypothetical protein AALP_AA1G172200 [Arabis alpina]